MSFPCKGKNHSKKFNYARGLICFLFSRYGSFYFKLLQHPEDFHLLESIYFKIIVLSYIPVLFKTSMESFLLGKGKPTLVFVSNLIDFLSNALLCYLFVLGPLSRLFHPLTGAAVATLIANCLATLVVMIFAPWQWQIEGIFQEIKAFLVQGTYTGLEKFISSAEKLGSLGPR